jgi:hypothetical protein
MIQPRKSAVLRNALMGRTRGLSGLRGSGPRLGVGDYFDGTHTWHFDSSVGSHGDYVNELGERANPEAPAPVAPPSPVGGKLGSSANSGGGFTYAGSSNPLLAQGVTSTFLGTTTGVNPNLVASSSAAQQFAAALGGTVVPDPDYAWMAGSSSTPILAIRLPDGTTVNAGAIGQILGNDAAFPGMNTKSGEIAKLFGAQYKPGIAEALLSGQRINLSAGAPAPGYLPTPLSKSYTAPASSSGSASPAPRASSAGGGLPGLVSSLFSGSPGAGPADSSAGAGGGVSHWVWLAGGVAVLFLVARGGGRS